MDRQIKKKKWTLQRIALVAGGILIVALIIYQLGWADRRQKLNVEREKITIQEVRRGVFQDYIPQTGTVEPAVTFYLDAIEGGTIKKVHAESGAMLAKGDIILELTNLNRELSVLSQEASLNESINRVRQTRLSLEQNDLQQQQTLAQIENELAKLEPQYERQKMLYEKKLISKQEFERTEADFLYNLKRKEITYSSYKNDSISRMRQLVQLNESERRMSASLDGVGQILDNLVIRSPIDGQLSTPQLFEGMAVNPGQRLGQIDKVGAYKVRTPIDELYLPRISKGLKATAPFNRTDYELVITYLYPTITNGRFEVDMEFTGEIPERIRRGQSVRLRIELGQSSEELLLPVGGFYKDSGGNWVFVVNEDETQAERRNIRLGRKNTEFFEVLEGLEPGDKVITSSYDNFGDSEVLILK
ncbi:efflux RND transporter periplasmic adaptor subunit [Fulvivirga sedimenti]|uniref:HlyD family efflux transporter periplasmic adaptor subunit n=1 Tax=Fulvivirga sedimenti TaxID=2879465 RepID=A0A9X1HQB4_9BACT|nr:HlyD family efflux transporter periplasmic adaptor subunit [Fulvivirga sedimenti]MCA6075186.1 HlyD family efflux transporter periplasmic adaptor subunit [Fulvivirga sedimenti]MCA6076363.1 HlyD family efflux transporter periplasmic adaptor subunit [Fulvivirga sedimenti]MCA6077491.1 HlyD family efflux transporter periplasmic adaptor subunit [Fulvivirga sedimenti]